MSVTKDALGETIKNARTAQGINQAQLAERLSIGKGYLMQIENSQKNPVSPCLLELYESLTFSQI